MANPLATGAVETALNGNKYTLTLGADDTWSATYLQPAPQPLQLGSTGDVLLVYRKENGTYLLDGEQLLGGRVVTASNGQRYRLSLRTGQDGMVSWVANYQTSTVSVTLGAYGGSVNLTRTEEGTWKRGSMDFSSGDTVTGVNGFEYRLTLGADGTWIVESLPATINVTVIGANTTIELARYEDGSFRHGDRIVASGDEIDAGDNTYRLRYANRRWTATFLQGEVKVPLGAGSDTITLIKKADGTYELNGTRVRNASVVRSPNTGIRYRLSLSNGVWSSSVYIPPTTDPGDGGGGGTDPVVAVESIMDALPLVIVNEQGQFVANSPYQADIPDRRDSNGTKVDYSPYDGSGRYEDDTFVEIALRAINKILGPIEQKGLADGTDSEQFVARVLVNAHWSEVKSALDLIFGAAEGITFSDIPPGSSGGVDKIDLDDALDDLEDVRDDLSDVASFTSAYSGKFQGSDGDQIFNARKRVLALGASSNTRFGVIVALDDPSKNAKEVVDTTGNYSSNVFAFSPLKATPSADLPSRGTARYSGSTWAVDSDEVLYSGTVELLASVGIEQINGKVSNLRRADNPGSRWKHEGKDVREIQLPQITESEFFANNSFSRTGALAKVVYEELGGLFPDDEGSSEHGGQFVGRDADNQAGIAVIGSWKVGSFLKGSYGAEYVRTNPVGFPASSDAIVYGATSINTGVTFDTTAKTLQVDSFSTDSDDLFQLSNLNNRTLSKTDGTKTATVRLRSTSFARFGVWKVADSSDNSTGNGIFRYSPLAQTSYTGLTDDRYPRRVSAVYTGKTVAIDGNGNLYDGSYQLKVDWSPTGAVGGNLSAVINSLRTVSGSKNFEIGSNGVSLIRFVHDSFTGTTFSTPATTVQYTNGSTEVPTSHAHEGAFVGNTAAGDTGVDGPFGVVGHWTVTKASDTIKGAFGAALVRSP